jgi:hypothetical protein
VDRRPSRVETAFRSIGNDSSSGAASAWLACRPHLSFSASVSDVRRQNLVDHFHFNATVQRAASRFNARIASYSRLNVGECCLQSDGHVVINFESMARVVTSRTRYSTVLFLSMEFERTTKVLKQLPVPKPNTLLGRLSAQANASVRRLKVFCTRTCGVSDEAAACFGILIGAEFWFCYLRLARVFRSRYEASADHGIA